MKKMALTCIVFLSLFAAAQAQSSWISPQNLHGPGFRAGAAISMQALPLAGGPTDEGGMARLKVFLSNISIPLKGCNGRIGLRLKPKQLIRIQISF